MPGGLVDGFSARERTGDSRGRGGGCTGLTRGGGDGHIYLPVLATPLIWRWTRQKRARIEEGLGVGEPCGCAGGRWSVPRDEDGVVESGWRLKICGVPSCTARVTSSLSSPLHPSFLYLSLPLSWSDQQTGYPLVPLYLFISGHVSPSLSSSLAATLAARFTLWTRSFRWS